MAVRGVPPTGTNSAIRPSAMTTPRSAPSAKIASGSLIHNAELLLTVIFRANPGPAAVHSPLYYSKIGVSLARNAPALRDVGCRHGPEYHRRSRRAAPAGRHPILG